MRHISQTAADLLAGRRAHLPDDDLMALSVACYTSGVGPLLGWWSENGLLRAARETAALLQLHLEQSRERVRSTEEQSRQVVAALLSRDVSTIVLKGGYTAQTYFPEPAARPASDLDLLVPPDCKNAAEAVLRQSGLECVSRSKRTSTWMPAGRSREPRSLWLVRGNDPWSVDLHHSLDLAAGPGAPIARLDSVEPFSFVQPWPLDGRAGALPQPLLLLHLAMHASGGLQTLTLLRMIEIIFVVRRDFAGEAAAWHEFVSIGVRTNGLGTAFPALYMSDRLAPGTVPPAVLEASGELTPPRLRAIVKKLDPATVQRLDRSSLTEHFMWVTGWRALLRQLRADIAPDPGSPESLWTIYEARANRLLHGRVTR